MHFTYHFVRFDMKNPHGHFHSLYTSCSRYVLYVECHVTFVFCQTMICLTWKKHTNTHRFVSNLSYLLMSQRKDAAMQNSQLWKDSENLTCCGLSVYLSTSCVHLGQLCDTVSHDYLIESATGNRDDPLVNTNTVGAPVWEGGRVFYLSGRSVNVTWLPDIHPSCWIMSVTDSKQSCVDLWSGLTISTHPCKRAWLGHCMITWPCCRFITLSLSLWWGFLSRVKHNLFFVLFCFFVKKKK